MVKDYLVKVRLDCFEADFYSLDNGILEVGLCVDGEDAFGALQSASIALADMTNFVEVKESV